LPTLRGRLTEPLHSSDAGIWAMAAGLKGIDWRELSAEEKDRLRRQVTELDAEQ
jgi:hypothetical protein